MIQATSILLLLLFNGSNGLPDNNACKTYFDYWINDISSNCFYNPDVGKYTPEILRNHVDYYENHTVVTEDGYILHVFRIPKRNPKGVVILQHPLAVDGIIWIAQSNTSLAFLLWNQGYEIWLPNQRGTFFSDKHVNLTVNDFEFWNYTFHEVGIYDLSSTIKYISNITNNNKLIIIGHSQGTTAFQIYASLKPDEAKKFVKVFIEMSPATYFSNMKSPIRYLTWTRELLMELSNYLKIGSVFRYNFLLSQIFRLFRYFPFKYLVQLVFFDFSSGWTSNEFDPLWYKMVFSIFPRDMSVKTLAHYLQLIRGTFNFFDYGKNGNLLRYHVEVPPDYPVWNISVPIYMIVSDKDTITTVEDAEILYSKLPNQAKIYGMYVTTKLNHVDFMFGKHRKKYAYDPIFRLLDKIL